MYSEYISLYDYTTGTPETNFVIQVDDDKYVAVINGQLLTDNIYGSKDAVVAANIGITNLSFVYEGVENEEEVTPPVGGETPEQGGSNDPQTPKILYAIGDSITNGSGGSDRWTIKAGWLKYVVTEENGFDIVNSKNLGISGLGFVHKDHNYGLTARDVIENTEALKTAGDNNNDLVDVSAKFGEYDLAKADIITVAFDINDWKDASNPVAIEAYFEEMEYCLEKIREFNSDCKIYYILPFNASVCDTYDTHFAFDSDGEYASTICYGNTLSEFKKMIRGKIEGELAALNIDIIEIEGLNRDELQKYKDWKAGTITAEDRLTDDGLHPNAAGYEKIGLELAELIK